MYPRIRALREDNDLTQVKLAKILGMSQTGYSKYETGENDIPTSILIKLSLLYDTSIDYLLGMTDYRKPYPINKPNVFSLKDYKSKLNSEIKERANRQSRTHSNMKPTV